MVVKEFNCDAGTAGQYALIHSWPLLCPSSDGLIGTRSRELGTYATMEEAQVARNEWYESSGYDENNEPCWQDGVLRIAEVSDGTNRYKIPHNY
jgi:hypothetical protein